MYVLAFPSGKTYGCFFRKTWPTRLQGTISRLPPHIHTLKEISARQPCPPSLLCLLDGGAQDGSVETPGARESQGAGRAGRTQPRVRRLPACSTGPATSASRPTTRIGNNSHLGGWFELTGKQWAAGRSTQKSTPVRCPHGGLWNTLRGPHGGGHCCHALAWQEKPGGYGRAAFEHVEDGLDELI